MVSLLLGELADSTIIAASSFPSAPRWEVSWFISTQCEFPQLPVLRIPSSVVAEEQ